MISQKTINEIFEAAKVEDVISEYVPLKKRGVNLIGLCPFHNEKTPSFTVSPAKNIYKCFGCGAAGNAVNFLMEHNQMTYPEALRNLAARYNIEVEETRTTEEGLAERQLFESMYLVNEFAQKFYAQQLFETSRGKSVGLAYFKDRGFREETIKAFGLGYAPPSGNMLTKAALDAGYKMDLLQKAGLTTSKGRDFFWDRVQFVIHNISGKVVGFGGRILNKQLKGPKYINTAESEIYKKSKILYGAYQARRSIRRKDQCLLVEGYTDVISLHQAGIENVVASSGTALTVEQIRLVKRYTQNMCIIYDGDAAGIKAAMRGLDLVLEQDMNVKIVLLPDGEDPDSFMQSVGLTKFEAYLESEAADFIFFEQNFRLEEDKVG
ncbi:MAG: DNA primase, partial [Bacteroidota bacterium]